ncbi:MAG: glycoside hydrolase family 127 protein, partial [Anaerolineales bacterium]
MNILPGYWQDRLVINADSAIFHQWEQLQASGCIQNFRIAAGEVEGFRTGWFFADSDAFKWLDAASRILASTPDARLEALVDDFINLIKQAQQPDGYLYTYNQIFFPGTRWNNLQIEHELYCHGHLIEAGVSHYEATSRTDLLAISRRAAELIVSDFSGKGPEFTPGHQEIEIAMLRLYHATRHEPYLEIARQFIEQRGKDKLFFLSILNQNGQVAKREKVIQQNKSNYFKEHPDAEQYQMPPGNESKKPPGITLRWMFSALTGKYFQQHKPIRKQEIPVGHSVRFAYLETAVAMLARAVGDRSFIPPLEKTWDHMVSRRMYLTGGIGSLPAIEGFGNDFELDPEFAYAETCAALACMFWDWEMALLTGNARYSDLFEWQLYNAASVGMGFDGKNYFYNNPLTCRGGVTRQPWYAVPCCPSNISRTFADIGKFIVEQKDNAFYIHQYISSMYQSDLADIEINSDLPWDGKVKIEVNPTAGQEFSLNLRIPSWSIITCITCNGELLDNVQQVGSPDQAAGGFDPRSARWYGIQRCWQSGDRIEIEFDMTVQLRMADLRVKGHQAKAALSRGPLVYCLESTDNPNIDIFNVVLDQNSLTESIQKDLFKGTMLITAAAIDGKPLTF